MFVYFYQKSFFKTAKYECDNISNNFHVCKAKLRYNPKFFLR